LLRAAVAPRSYLDSWPRIGRVAAGMHRQGYDLQLTKYDERGWRATFYTTGTEHSPTSATGLDGKRRRGMRPSGRRGTRWTAQAPNNSVLRRGRGCSITTGGQSQSIGGLGDQTTHGPEEGARRAASRRFVSCQKTCDAIRLVGN